MKYPQLVSMPSAVSDWLEEQLEARGIDAVVYTRYVLSLLHRDTLDLVSSDQDIQLPKDVRQTGGRGRKRFRRSAEWWSHVRADVEQLRRSAAVECLMSASDQKCGIESLVDELCEKLKDFESTSTVTNEACDEDDDTTGKPEKGVISPNDLARRYYAAFPPLNNNNINAPTKSSDLITLIPQLYTTTSTTTNNNQTIGGLINKRKHASRKNLPQIRSTSRDTLQRKTDFDNMKSRSSGKQRFSYFGRGKKDFGFARSMEKSEWDLYFINGHNRADEGYSTSDTTGVDEAEECEIMDDSGDKTNIDDGHLAQLVAKFDQRIEALWKTDEEDNYENEYHDLPVDLQELLSSPAKIDAIELPDKREKSKSFIQCGTNITSSIWSENITNSIWSECADEDKSLYDSISYCNLYNETLESFPDKILGDQFNSLSMKADHIDLGTEPEIENETNLFYENFSNENNNKLWKLNSLKQDFTSLPWELTFPIGSFNNKKWSDAENYSYADSKFSPDVKIEVNKVVNDSLSTLNHNKEASCFKEVVPKQVLGLPAFTVPDLVLEDDPATKEEEDLLTSTRTHFRPIKETTETTSTSGAHYADGTTFAIRSSLEHVNYKRSESGTLYLESGLDSPKKYMEYRVKDVPITDTESCYSIEREFVLKFCVKQNEKCCQTEIGEAVNTSHSPLEVPAKKRVLCDPEEFFFPGDEELLSDTVDAAACECKCPRTRAKLATNLEPLFAASSETCAVHGGGGGGGGGARPDSTEITWNTSWKKCDKCNNNWSAVWPKPETWQTRGDALGDAQSWQHIWSSSEELCRTCLGMPAGTGVPTGRSMEYFKLREELSEDGEQLLSDLSCLQRVYMEQLPSTEVSCNLNEPATVMDSGNKERKRRHSSSQRPAETVATAVSRNSWTNASCLRSELRCHFTPPLLRPVTL